MRVMMAPFKNPKIIKNANIKNANGQFVFALSAAWFSVNNSAQVHEEFVVYLLFSEMWVHIIVLTFLEEFDSPKQFTT